MIVEVPIVSVLWHKLDLTSAQFFRKSPLLVDATQRLEQLELLERVDPARNDREVEKRGCFDHRAHPDTMRGVQGADKFDGDDPDGGQYDAPGDSNGDGDTDVITDFTSQDTRTDVP